MLLLDWGSPSPSECVFWQRGRICWIPPQTLNAGADQLGRGSGQDSLGAFTPALTSLPITRVVLGGSPRKIS